MKKLIYLIVLTLILGLVLTGCLLSNVGQVPTSEQSGVTYLTRNTESDPMQIDLMAGQTEDIGDVLVWNDADTLYVKFVYTGSDCGFLEVHLQVDEGEFSSDILTKKGNPIPGKFEKSYDVGCFTQHTFTYNLAEEGFGCDDKLVIAAHAALGIEKTMTFESNVGDTVYGPIYSDDMPTEWGDPGFAVRAYNWLGYERDLSDPDQIPGCTTNPYSSLTWSWGFGLNPTYSPDISGVLWISTAPNTEMWYIDSWRKFVENYEVPGFPISGSLQVNADNYYVVSNGETIGSDDNIFNGAETYTFYPNEGMNTLEFVTENLRQGSATNYCDQLANPNGITYKSTVSYYADGETAWGCGNDSAEPNCHEFEGKNWATYFEYTVEGYCPCIIGTSTNIEVLGTPPTDVRVGQFENDDYVRVWKEFEGLLEANLHYDLDEDLIARTNGPPIDDLFIPAGTYVCIYYVHLDNVGPSSTVQHTGQITFGADILGLIISGGNLGDFAGRDLMFSADDQIGSSGTMYPDDTIHWPPNLDYLRGFDVNYGNNLDDAVFDGPTVDFTMWVVNAHDSFRVILPMVLVPCE